MLSIQVFPVSKGKGNDIDMMTQMRQLSRRIIETNIVHQLQHLSAAIIQERVQAIANIQVLIFELRAAFDALSTNTVPAQHLRESRSEGVVIGRFV